MIDQIKVIFNRSFYLIPFCLGTKRTTCTHLKNPIQMKLLGHYDLLIEPG